MRQRCEQLAMYALIMAGGRGTRFWPESTSHRPKQYLPLLDGRPLLSETLRRLDSLVDLDKRYIVTVKEQESLARQCSEKCIHPDNIIFEPFGKNTAPCILLSLATLINHGAATTDVVAIIPSDHVILNNRAFHDTIQQAASAAREQKKIVTIGIPPTTPHTGYGYIHKGQSQGDGFSVKGFVEKPDFETAKKYLRSGEYYWNSGMFVSTIGVFLQSFASCAPEHYAHFEDLLRHARDPQKVADIYARLPADSIDYAVMEKSTDIMVFPSTFDWNDLGSWEALESIHKPVDGNTLVKGKGYYFESAQGNIVHAEGKFIALVGVNDLTVVANEKALLVLPKQESQSVKKVIEWLKTQEEYKYLI